MSRNTFTAVSWTNSIGQTINPGDDVVYVGTGYSNNITVKTAKFEGVYTDYNNNIVSVRVGGINDERYHWTGDRETSGYKPIVRKAILPRMRVFKISGMTAMNTVDTISQFV